MSNTLKLGNGKWATGKDTVLSFSDTNNNYKPLAFSFSRDSSGTVINKAGLIETVGSGEPRIDFKDNTKGSLLLEPSRTNLVTYSEDFSQGFYAKDSGVSIGTENNISPNGTLNATEINVTNNGRIYANVTTDTYYSSVFIKSESFSHFKLVSSNIDLINETNSNGSIENYGNGWFRIGISYTGNRPFQIQAYPDNSYSSHTTSGNYYIYGVQIEQGSYATSYIPTSGQANGVTRVADSSSQTVPDGVIGQTEGTLFLDFIYNHSNTSISENVSLSDGSSSNRLYIGNVFANTLSCVVIASSVLQFSAITSYDLVIGQRYKAAICYKLNDFSFYVNGVEIATDTSGSVPLMNRVGFDSGSGTSKFYKPTNDVKLYNTRLSNSELAALTTI